MDEAVSENDLVVEADKFLAANESGKGSSMNDVSALWEREYQGFCDDSDKNY